MIQLQSVCRGNQLRARLAHGFTLLQRVWRAHRALKQSTASAMTLQRVARGYLLRRVLRSGITKLQARVRGHIHRRKIARNRRVLAVRAKLARAAARAAAQPELRLGNRTARALSMLQSAKMLTHVMQACSVLETSTRYVGLAECIEYNGSDNRMCCCAKLFAVSFGGRVLTWVSECVVRVSNNLALYCLTI